jgi:hypothetical protein
MSVVLLALSRLDAASWCSQQPAPPTVIVVTPTTRNAARGYRADAVLTTPAMADDPRRWELAAEVLPCMRPIWVDRERVDCR